MTTGTISLYNSHGARLARYQYRNKEQRQNIVKVWQEVYGGLIRGYYYHISPDIDEANLLNLPKLKNVG